MPPGAASSPSSAVEDKLPAKESRAHFRELDKLAGELRRERKFREDAIEASRRHNLERLRLAAQLRQARLALAAAAAGGGSPEEVEQKLQLALSVLGDLEDEERSLGRLKSDASWEVDADADAHARLGLVGDDAPPATDDAVEAQQKDAREEADAAPVSDADRSAISDGASDQQPNDAAQRAADKACESPASCEKGGGIMSPAPDSATDEQAKALGGPSTGTSPERADEEPAPEPSGLDLPPGSRVAPEEGAAAAVGSWGLGPEGPAGWQPDLGACQLCAGKFTLTKRRHHCRQCGGCICARCSPFRVYLPAPLMGGRWQDALLQVHDGSAHRVCVRCHGPGSVMAASGVYSPQP